MKKNSVEVTIKFGDVSVTKEVLAEFDPAALADLGVNDAVRSITIVDESVNQSVALARKMITDTMFGEYLKCYREYVNKRSM